MSKSAADPDADVGVLRATQAITATIYRYCRALDRIDTEVAKSVWHADGTAHYSAIFQGTGHEFVDWVDEAHRNALRTSHQVSNVIVEVADDLARAVSEAYVTVRIRNDDGDGGFFHSVNIGRYLDRWSFRDGRWAIDHREFVNDFMHVIPGLPDMDPIDNVPVIEPQRNGDDPSYELLRSL